MQCRLEGVCHRGGSTSEDGIRSHWGISNRGSEKRRHWNWLLKNSKRRAFHVEGEWELRASIRFGIPGVPTHTAGRSWAVLHNEAGKKSDHEEFWMPEKPYWLQACPEWLCQPAIPTMLPYFPDITQEETTQKEYLSMPHIRRSAVSKQSVIPLKGKTMCLYTFAHQNFKTKQNKKVKYPYKMIKTQFHLILATE